MADRYFSDAPITADGVTLAGPEAHHLIHVMRARPGAEVVLFDGSGAEWQARVEQVGRAEVRLAAVARREIDRESAMQFTLGVALPKGDRQKWLVEKAVELGVRRLVPLLTSRGVAQPTGGALDRLRRSVVEASKQCGRNRLMEIADPLAWNDYSTASDSAALRLLAHPQREKNRPRVFPKPDVSQRVFAAVGPEGGFTDDEISSAIAGGWQCVDLGPRTLRVETAAIAIIAIIMRLD
jgi:16S rRNA (uracil1498-N3)-methyltransferase